MSKHVLTNALVTIAGVNASGYTSAVTVDVTSEEVDITALGDPYRQTMAGQQTAQVTLDVFSGLSTLETVLRSAYDAGTSVDVALRARNVAQSAQNPTWTVPCVVTAYAPWGGPVGDAARPIIRLATAGDVTIDDTAAFEAVVVGSSLVVI